MKFSELSFVLIFVLIPGLHGVIPGGEQEIPLDDPEVVRLSQVALVKLNEGKVGATSKNLVEVIKATRQIVAGTLTRLTLRIAEGEVKDTCEVKIWEQPWLNKTEVTFTNCGGVQEETSSKKKRYAVFEAENAEEVMLFNNFIKKYNRIYDDKYEYDRRFQIFQENLQKIKFLRKTEQGTAEYGLTQFSDLSTEEFKQYLGYQKSNNVEPLPQAEIPDVELPEMFDWRQHNAVTSVKNQKSCGSCWAFSVSGNIEGQWAIKKGELLSLSEQELLDCDKVDKACMGGEMVTGFKMVKNLGGLETETDYPYDAREETCTFNISKVKVKISGAVNISNDEEDMAKWLYKNGPISVALNAIAMQFYFGGVSHPLTFLCNPMNLDHGVLIVGFGTHKSLIRKKNIPYWLIKNSWGEKWGERGYYKLFRGDGSCGINLQASSSTVD